MAEEQFRLTICLELQSSLHIAGPGRTLPLVDRSVDVDEGGMPFIPASSFRGRLRAHVERLLNAFGEEVCSAPRSDRMCPHKEFPNKPAPYYCRACRIFGSSWRLSAVTFTDFVLSEDQQAVLASRSLPLRTHVSINRRLNTAEEQRLLVVETVPNRVNFQSLHFQGQVEGWLTREDLGWLLAGLCTLTHVGGSKARGLGRIKVAGLVLEVYDGTVRQWQRREWREAVKEVMSRGAA